VTIDAHAHVVAEVRGLTGRGPVRGAGRGRVTWGGELLLALPAAAAETAFPPSALLAAMDAAEVDHAVLLQGCFWGEQNAYAAAACRAHPDRFTGMAFVDPWTGGAREAFAAIEAAGVLRGVKLELSVPTGLLGLHPGASLGDPGIAWLWSALEARGLTLVLDLGRPGSPSYQTDRVRAIMRAHPRLRIVIAHLGQPGPWTEDDSALRRAWEDQLGLAREGALWFDGGSLPAYWAEEGAPWPGAAAALRAGLDAAGPRRVLWGTDAPGVLSLAPYGGLRRFAEAALAGAPAADREAFLGQNAREAFEIS
jgi:predicted TIM-barrel fold metal-dependent hydrolase